MLRHLQQHRRLIGDQDLIEMACQVLIRKEVGDFFSREIVFFASMLAKPKLGYF